jgi:hypothetical protein
MNFILPRPIYTTVTLVLSSHISPFRRGFTCKSPVSPTYKSSLIRPAFHFLNTYLSVLLSLVLSWRLKHTMKWQLYEFWLLTSFPERNHCSPVCLPTRTDWNKSTVPKYSNERKWLWVYPKWQYYWWFEAYADLHLVLRSRMVGPYLQCPISLDDAVLN